MLDRSLTRQGRRGATAVETAVILIPFLVLVFAILDYGRFVMTRNLVVNAAREGARLALVNSDVNDNSSNKTTEEIRAHVVAALAAQPLGNLQVQVYHADDTGQFVDGQWASTATYQQAIAVEITAEYSPLFPTFGFFSPTGNNTIPVRGKSVMRSEGH